MGASTKSLHGFVMAEAARTIHALRADYSSPIVNSGGAVPFLRLQSVDSLGGVLREAHVPPRITHRSDAQLLSQQLAQLKHQRRLS